MTAISRNFVQRIALIATFIAVHGWLVWQGIFGIAHPMGDITGSYLAWVEQLNAHAPWFGLAQPWVYPYPDLLFVYGPAAFPGAYPANWLIMATVLDLVAMICLIGLRGQVAKYALRAGWLWAGLLLLIGPVGISRLDNLSVALAVLAVALWSRNRVRLAASVAAFAVWVKVWPVALVLGFLTDAKRQRSTLIWAGGTGVAILVFGILIGGPANVLSFITLQSTRGIQLEAPVADFWLWSNTTGSNMVYFDNDLVTFQIRGPFTDVVSTLMGPAQLIALGITAVLAFIGARGLRTSDDQTLQRELIAVATLTATLDLIVFNKVGSPQYYGWLFVPAIMFLLWGLSRALVPVSTIALITLLTQFIYPVLYDHIILAVGGAPWVLIGRNLLVIALLVYANGRLIQFSSSSRMSGPTLSRSIKNPS